MSFIKKISFLASLVFVFGLALSVFAQELPQLPPVPTSTTSIPENISDFNAQASAEVYVENLVLDKEVYQAGDTVKGSFTLLNNREEAVSDVYYEVALVGNYREDTLAGTFYDSVKMGPYYLLGRELRNIDFTYVLPKVIAGDGLGIEVTASLATGFSMGWRDVMIKIEGEMNFLNLTEASVSIGSDEFGVQIGPTVYENETAFLNITLNNPTKNVIEVIPQVKIYNRAAPLTTQVLQTNPVKVSVGDTTSVKYELPKFDNHAGVCVGNVEFLDANNIKRAISFEFRYIIGGDIATINGLTVDKSVVNKGDDINVKLLYSGSVFDVRDSEQKINAVYNLDIKLFSESNKLVAEFNSSQDFNKGREKIFTLKAIDEATTLRAEVTIKKGESILAEYKSNLPKIKSEDRKSEKEKGLDYKLIGWLLVIIGLISIIFFSSLKMRNKIIISLLLVILGVGSPFNLVKSFVYVGSATSGTGDAPTNIQIFVNSPSGEYDPGESFSLVGSTSAENCSNQFMYLKYYYFRESYNTDWVLGGETLDTTGRTTQDYAVTRSTQFSMGPFNAENTEGDYKIYVLVYAYPYWKSTIKTDQWSYSYGYQPYTVVDPVVDGDCGFNLANGSSFPAGSTLPADQLCSDGTATPVTGTGPWTWDCNGSSSDDSHENDHCSASVLTPLSSVSCSADRNTANADTEPVTWTTTFTGGAAPFTYFWEGTDSLTGNTQSVSKIYTTVGTKYATSTIYSGSPTLGNATSSTVGCTVPISDGGEDGGGRGVNITRNGECKLPYGSIVESAPTESQLCDYTSTTPIVSSSTDSSDPWNITTTWSWTCSGLGNNAANADCLARLKNTDESMGCTLSMNPPYNQVNINTNTTWEVSPTSALDVRWRIVDANGTTYPIATGYTLNQIFTTVGLKTISAQIISATGYGEPCSATTTVVLQGGGIGEQ